MSVLTPNFQPKPSRAVLKIYDYDGNLDYQYESKGNGFKTPLFALPLNGTRRDVIGNYDGVWSGNEDYEMGDIDYCASFNGSSSIIVSNSAAIPMSKTDSFTISGRFRVDTLGSKMIFAKGTQVNVSKGVYIFVNSSNNFVFQIMTDDEQINNVAAGNGAVKINTWYEFSCTYGGTGNRSSMKMEFNGTTFSGSSAVFTGTDITNGSYIAIGSESDGGIKMIGNINYINFHTQTITTSEQKALISAQNYYGCIPRGSDIQDFNLTDITLDIESNDNYGLLGVLIEDFNGALLDFTSNRRAGLIKPQYRVELWLGKTSYGMQRWFNGVIVDSNIIRPQTNDERVSLDCIGTGLILKERLTIMQVNQDKKPDGILLDDVDNKTRLDKLIEKLITDKSHQIDENMPLITSIKVDLTENGVDPETLNIKVANVNERFTSYASFISRVAGVANADWYVNADNRLIVRDGNIYDSGVLATNNLTGIDAQGWDSKKLAYIVNQPLSWKDTSIEGMWSWIHGAGHFVPIKEFAQEQTPDATDDMINEWLAIPTNNKSDNIFKIALRMSKTGTPQSGHAEIRLVGGDGSGEFAQGSVNLTGGASGSVTGITVNGVQIMSGSVPYSGSLRATAMAVAGNINEHVSTPDYVAFVNDASKIIIQARSQTDLYNSYAVVATTVTLTHTDVNMGTEKKGITGLPNYNDVRRVIKIPLSKLVALPTSTPADWIEFQVTPKLDIIPSEQIWIIMPNYGITSNTINVDYKTGSGKYFTSPDGYTWYEVTGEPNVRVWSAKRLTTTVENTKLSKILPEPREKLFPMRGDLEEQTVRQALIQAVTIIGQERRYYSNLVTTIPEKRIDLASYMRFQDVQTGLDVKAKITAYHLEAHENDSSGIGVRHIKLSLDEIVGE